MKAATPITGGMIEPPEEAAASMPPANTLEKPRLIIIGMVSTPVDKTLTIGPPDMVPNMADDTIAAWAGPPASLRVQRKATLISERPPAEAPNSAPRMRYGKISLRMMSMNRPSRPEALLTRMSCTRGRPSDSRRGSPPILVTRYLLMSSTP